MPRGSCVATLFRRRSSKVPLYMLLLLLFQYPPATLSDSSIPRSSWERLRKAKKRSSPTNYTNTSNSTAFDTPLLGFLRNCVLLLVQQQQQHIMHHTIVKPSSSKIQNMAIKRMSVQISLEMNVTLFGKDFFDRIVRKRHCPDAGVFLNRRLEPLEGMDGGPASDRVQQKEKKPKQAVATAWILRWKTFSEAVCSRTKSHILLRECIFSLNLLSFFARSFATKPACHQNLVPRKCRGYQNHSIDSGQCL